MHGFQLQWNLVDHIRSDQRNHGFRFDVTKFGDFPGQLCFDRVITAGDDHIGEDTNRAQLSDRVLGRFGFGFGSGFEVGQPGNMHKRGIVFTHLIAHFANGFEKRLSFNVAYGTTDFDQDDFGLTGTPQQVDAAFNFVGDMRNHLDCAAQIISAAFPVDHFFIHLPCRNGTGAFQAQVAKAFVMPKVEVSF